MFVVCRTMATAVSAWASICIPSISLLSRAWGGEGFTSEDPADCGRVVEQFLNVPSPAILQAVVDPLEPPLPAKVTAEQALKFAESLVRGEPNRTKIALTAISDKLRELV